MLKDYDMDILYHPGKANVVADSLSRKPMGSLSYLQPEKIKLAHTLYQLASMDVRLIDSEDARVTVQNATTTCLVT